VSDLQGGEVVSEEEEEAMSFWRAFSALRIRF